MKFADKLLALCTTSSKTSGFSFVGSDKRMIAAALNEFGTDVINGKIALQGLKTSTEIAPDDFVIRTLTISYAERETQ